MIRETHCMVCGTTIYPYGAVRCKSCETRRRWDHGGIGDRERLKKKSCTDCGKDISHHATRCKSCSVKRYPVHTHSIITKERLRAIKKGKKNSEISKMRASVSLKRYNKLHPDNIKKILRRHKISSLELKMQKIINALSLPYKFVGNGDFVLEQKVPDFINTNGKKVAIEVYYRNHKEMFRGGLYEWKKKRTSIFNSYGWKLVFFDETQVNEKNVAEQLTEVIS